MSPRRALLPLMIALTLCCLSAPTLAKKPAKVFKGEIVISLKRFPYRFKSDKHMVSFLKKHDTKKIKADEDGDWSFEYMVFSSKPVGTLQAALTFYDITDGRKRRIDTFTVYPHDESDTIISGHAELSGEKFEPNRKYLMVFSRGYGADALSKTKIVLYPNPKAEKKKEDSGVVNF